MNIFICANLYKDKIRDILSDVVRTLKRYDMKPFAENMYIDICREMSLSSSITFGTAEENMERCDIILTVGGDGTILRWGKRAALFGKPLVGINMGRLGFMATLEKDSLQKLSALAEGKYKLNSRMMLDVNFTAGGEEKSFTALNDVVLFKGTTSKLPEYLVFSGKTEVTRVRADGLIISTPTGSTAYSLSAGGPIIDPKISCFELTALAPHNLFNRPMLLSVDDPLRIEYIAYENSTVSVSVDGNEWIQIMPDENIKIKRSELSLDLIDIDGESFYSSVHNKLMEPLK